MAATHLLPVGVEDQVADQAGGGLAAGGVPAEGRHAARPAVPGGYWGCAKVNHSGWTGHLDGVRPWEATKLWKRAHWPGSASLDRLSAQRLSPVAILVL